MKFYLSPAPTFNTTVKLSVPENTSYAEVEFTFKYKDKDELDQWVKDNKTKPTAKALLEIVEAWGVLGKDDQPVEVTLENMITLAKKYPHSLTEIFMAYYMAIADSRIKN